jgi:hypothetical protein
MSALGCAEVRELAPELALGIVSGPQRADALQHASECGPCRALVGELAEAADALPLLATEAEPPPGFEQRVLSALKAPRRRTRRRVAAALAAAAAAASIVSIVGVRIVESTQEDTTTSAAAATKVRSAEMIGANGLHAGNAFVSNGDPASVVVSVNYGVPAGTYGIEYRASSTTERIGDMRIGDDGQGSWGGVTQLPNDGNGSIVLVDTNGNAVCESRRFGVS